MRTLGIDLAAGPDKTAACLIEWSATGARAELCDGPMTDERLLELITGAGVTKAGIDCPLGWPRDFVAAVTAHQEHAGWPGRGLDPEPFRRTLRFRLTDRLLQEGGGRPLSVTSDRIGVTAMRCALLLDALAVRDGGRHRVDRTGAGRVLEVYPAAALRTWHLPYSGYKKDAAPRAVILDRIAAAVPGLDVGAVREACVRSDDALDALVAALVARAAALGRTLPPAPGEQTEYARTEGWIHLPACDLSDVA